MKRRRTDAPAHVQVNRDDTVGNQPHLPTFGLKPHLVDVCKLSAGTAFVEKVRDVVGLYVASPEKATVLSEGEQR